MKKITKILIPIVGGLVVVGTVLIFDGKKPCGIDLYDVNNKNFSEKIIEKINETETQNKDYVYGCDIEEIEVSGKSRAVQLANKNCKTKSSKQWSSFKNETIEKFERIDEFQHEERLQIYQDLLDIWNYHLFEKCGLK